MKRLANSPRMVNSERRILWSGRQGHCLIAPGSPPQQTGRHGVDIGICGIRFGADRHIPPFVPRGCTEHLLCASTVITQRRAHHRGPEWAGVSRKICWRRRKTGTKGRSARKGTGEREDVRALGYPTKGSAFSSWGFPATQDFSQAQSPGGWFDSQGSSWAVRWVKTFS